MKAEKKNTNIKKDLQIYKGKDLWIYRDWELSKLNISFQLIFYEMFNHHLSKE